MTENSTDSRQRFVFDELDARGCIVHLNDTCAAIQATHHYPQNLAKLLNEFALAATLLRDSIKIDGSLTIQLRTPGAISLIMADCMSDRRVRAIAEYDNESLAAGDAVNLNALGDGAVLAITITPDEGERYQSIVPIDRADLSGCLQDYFARSEQLPSLFRLFANEDHAMGIALHALPERKDGMQQVEEPSVTTEDFDRLSLLLNTLTESEALELNSTDLLTRLFHQESCRLFDSYEVKFGCVCSAAKSIEAIKSLGKNDVAELISEQQLAGNQSLVVDCHFCFQRYEFDFNQLDDLLAE